MRSSPPCRFTVTRFGAWRAAVALLVGSALASLAAWSVGSPSVLRAWVLPLVAMAVATVVALGIGLWRQSPVSLSWDGSIWTLAEPDVAGSDRTGRLVPMIDLGSFLLLRFLPAAPAPRRSTRWIPVGRSGLEAQWHGIRCAVHGPVSIADAAQASFR